MPVTATTATQRPATAATESREPDEVEYPEGNWTAQSVWHGDAVMQAATALRHHFRGREDVLVAMELVIYYKRGDSTARLQPDVQVGRGGDRGTYKVWEEGKAPDFVLEVASPSTAENDARYKAGEYAGIGVRGYLRLDPKGSLMERPLEGYEMTGGRYKRVAAVKRKGRGRQLRSGMLDLDLRSRRRDGGTVLVFHDPQTGEEFDGALQAAGQRRAAEDRVRVLEERLRNLTAHTPSPERHPKRRIPLCTAQPSVCRESGPALGS